MSYASVEEIRSYGRNITAIREATNVEIGFWASEASAVINQFCNQDFSYEESATKQLPLYYGEGSRPYVLLPKALVGGFEVIVDGYAVNDYFYEYDGESLVLYYDGDTSYSSVNTVTIAGNWGHSMVPDAVKVVFLRLVKRLAIRANEEDEIQMNSGYTNETTGDGYGYSLGNGTLRNLLRPEEFVLLWPHVNHGIVVA